MTSPFADASVEVIADFDTFDDEFRRKLERTVKSAAKAASRDLEDIGKTSEVLAAKVNADIDRAMARMRGAFDSIVVPARAAFGRLGVLARGALDNVFAQFVRVEHNARTAFGNVELAAQAAWAQVKAMFADLADALQPLLGGLGQLTDLIGDIDFGDAAEVAAHAWQRLRGVFVGLLAHFPSIQHAVHQLADASRTAAARMSAQFTAAVTWVRGQLGKLPDAARAASLRIRAWFTTAGKAVRDAFNNLRSGQTFTLLQMYAKVAANRIAAHFRPAARQIRAALTVAYDPFRPLVDKAKDAGRRIWAHMQTAGRRAKNAFDQVAQWGVWARLALYARRAGNSIERSMQAAARAALKAFGYVALGAAAAAGIAVLSGALTGLVSAALALLAALAPVGGVMLALPAAVGGALVGVAALKLGLQGMGDALKATGGTAEEFNAAVGKLAPSARNFAVAVRGLRPALDGVQKAVQGALFANMGRALRQVAGNLLPTVRRGLVEVAKVANDTGLGIAELLAGRGAKSQITSILASAREAMDNLAEAAAPAVSAILGLTAAGGPGLIRMSQAVSDLALRFADWVEQASKSGRINELIQTGMTVARQFGQVLGNIGSIIGSVFSAANANGGGMLNTLKEVTGELRRFFGSVQGQEALGTFFASMRDVTAAVLPILGQLATIIGTSIAPMLRDLAVAVAPGLGALIDGLAKGFQALVPVAGPVGAAIGAIGTALAPVAGQLGSLIAAVLGPLAGAISKLMPVLGPLLDVLGAELVHVFQALLPPILDLARVLIGALVPPLIALMPVVTQVVGVLGAVLRPLVAALTPIIGALGGVLGVLAKFAADLLTPILALLPPLVGALMPAFASLVPVVTAVGDVLGELAPVLIEALLPVVEALLPALLPIVDIFAQLVAVLAAILVPVVKLLAPLLKFVVMIADWLILKPVIWLLEQLAKVLAPVAGWLQTAAEWINNIDWGNVGAAIGDFFKGIGSWFADLGSTIGDFFGGVGEAIGSFFTETIPGWFSSAVDAVSVFFTETIPGFVASLPGRLAGAALGLIGWVAGLPGRVWEALKGLGGRLWDAFKAAFVTAVVAVANGIGAVVGWFKGLPGRVIGLLLGLRQRLLDAFGAAMSAAVGAVSAGGARVIDWFKGLPGRVLDQLKGLKDKLFGLAGDILDGLKRGFENGKAKVAEAIKRLVAIIPKAVRDFLGISSPSKVLFRLGLQAGQGLDLALGSYIPRIRATMGAIAAQVARRIPGPVLAGASLGAVPLRPSDSALRAVTSSVAVTAPRAGSGGVSGALVPAQRAAATGAGARVAERSGAVVDTMNINLPTGDPEAAAQAVVNRIAARIM